jgi:1-acyl-sn-glycerol-3-phosphate acyltransferase
MYYLKKTLRFLFALWASLAVLVSLLIVTPLYTFIFLTSGKRAGQTAHKLSQLWGRYVLLVTGIRLRVHGREKLDPEETYVFVSNHRSQLDIPLCACATSHYFKFLAKVELVKIPLLGYIIRNLYITVGRKSLRDRVASLNKMKEALEDGASVWLYPEGTRNKSNEPLGPFFDGAFQLAIMSGRPLAVLTIKDTGRHLPAGELYQLIPGKVQAWWDEPNPTQGLTKADIAGLREKVKSLMLGHLQN